MYIRECKTKSKKSKTQYVTHKLVESYHTEKGSRQRVIMSLGTLDLPRSRWRELATLLEARINGQISFLEDEEDIVLLVDNALKHNKFVKRTQLEQKALASNEDMQMIDINSTETTLDRSLGAELVANTFWERLDMDMILYKCGFDSKQKCLAKAVILGRLINPDSELATWRWFQNHTALVEMTELNLEGHGKDAFYAIGDLLFDNKERLEQELYQQEQSIFTPDKKVYLYDLTNTYFEGSSKNNKITYRGHSKEKRTDCPLVTLALAVDEMGFPIFSQIYQGNQSEPQTLKDVLKKLEKDSSKVFGVISKPVLIMDRGIATKENIKMIKANKYPYTVINRRKTEKDYEKDFESIKEYIQSNLGSIPDGWTCIEDKGTVYVKKLSLDNNSHVLTASMGRTEKEQGMDALKEKRFLDDISRLKKSFEKGNIVIPVKIGERIGKIKAKYPTVGKYYEIELKVSDDGKKISEIKADKKPERKQRSILTGCYVIETTQTELSAIEVWKQYVLLTRVESAFQDLKSELGLRPINHQNENRTKAHLFIGVLAYHFLVSIENSLRAHGDTREWKTIKEVLSTHRRSTVIQKGVGRKVYHTRVSGTPEQSHNKVYAMLNIKNSLKTTKRCAI